MQLDANSSCTGLETTQSIGLIDEIPVSSIKDVILEDVQAVIPVDMPNSWSSSEDSCDASVWCPTQHLESVKESIQEKQTELEEVNIYNNMKNLYSALSN